MSKGQKHASELIPKNKAALRILKARAEELAKPDLDFSKNTGIDYVRFRLGYDESYGISYEYVREILHYIPIAKPPCVPYFIAGVINWRGLLITVVDLIHFFHAEQAEHRNEFIIVIQVEQITLGLLVHQIEGSKTYQPSQLNSPLASINVVALEYILGLDQSIIAILNAQTLVSNLNQEIKESLYRTGAVHGKNE